MNLLKHIKRSFNAFYWILDKVSKNAYIKLYPKYLNWLGIKIDPHDSNNTWISPTVFFDSSGYDLIEIGKNVTISFDVVILVHDFSIKHAARMINRDAEVKHSLRKSVIIGNNVFIGAKALILPGTIIEDDCIVGGLCGKRESKCREYCCWKPSKMYW